MTKQDFFSGWQLLVIQPWGRIYNKVDENGQPARDAVSQFQMYYEALKWAQPMAWMKVARQYAAGSKWPSVDELTASLRVVNQGCVPAIKDERKVDYCECPEDVRAVLDRLQCRQTFSFPAETQRERV